ncbi:MAG TPA: 23S rRNA (pseudouridine(1915)-N(3))-methyltransferase RlmH, partial [Mariprofundaceae bacterium]|nr:23S rRNA (pseudouridine(1915)-N(3))-methyltransferase RlmH [Mariprofundaceae bacterium]
MKLRLITVGKGASELGGFEAQFLKRLKGQCTFDIVELPEGKGKQLSQRKQEEEKQIMKTVGDDFILFDERGKSLTSIQWSESLQGLHGSASLDFVIGGAAGVSDVVRQKAKGCWSLSALTLPHKLARVLVIE